MHTIAEIKLKFHPVIAAATFTFYMLPNFSSSPLEQSPKHLAVKFSVSRSGAPWNKEQKECVAVPTTHSALAEFNIKMLLKTEGAN